MGRTPITLPFEGDLLRAWRERRGWSQDVLAKKCTELGTTPVSRFQVVRAETGKNKPTRETLEAFAAALEIEVEDLVASSTLTIFERNRLAELELRLKNRPAPGRLGRFLGEIRDGRLYRDSHRTFAGYCEARWGIGEPEANRLIDNASARLASLQERTAS